MDIILLIRKIKEKLKKRAFIKRSRRRARFISGCKKSFKA